MKKKTKHTNYCEAGFNHVWIRSSNEISACCSVVPAKLFPLNDTADFVNVMQSKEWVSYHKILKKKPLPECWICVNQDIENLRSTNSVNNIARRHKINQKTQNGFFLQLDFGNKCNLKCVMCNSKRSSSWYKDELKLESIFKNQHTDPTPLSELTDDWWERVPDDFWNNLAYIEIGGGEPFYQEQFFKFMNFIHDRKKVQINIITNGTIYNDQVDEFFSKHANPSLGLMVSVDAWQDEIYKYSRYGNGDLSTVKSNLIKYRKFVPNKMSVVDTIHPFNYDQPPIAKKWIKENITGVHHEVSYVYAPDHLDVRKVLPEKLWPGKKDLELQKHFAKWTLALDKIRKQNVFDIRPEFEPWFKELDVI